MSTSTLNTSWLDEELRKEKATVAALRDTVEKQQVAMSDQSQRIMALEERLAKLQAQLLKIPEVEESLRHTRDEVVLMMTELRQDQQKREAEFLRNRQAERERDVRAIQAIEMELGRFDPLEQAMAVRQAEDLRLNENVLRLQQALEGINRRIAQGEESRLQLAERIERNTVATGQLQLSIEDLRKAQQEQLPRILLVETSLSKAEQQIAELQTMRQELTKQQEELLENQRRVERERAQAMTEWGRRLDGYAHQVEVWAEQMRYFADQHDKNRRVLREIQDLAQEVSKQQDQLRQLQRIAEEQLRREFREWRGEVDRRWAQDLELREKTGAAQVARDSAQDERIVAIEALREQDVKVIQTMNQRIGEVQAELSARLNTLRAAQLRALHLQAEATAENLAELNAILGEEGK